MESLITPRFEMQTVLLYHLCREKIFWHFILYLEPTIVKLIYIRFSFLSYPDDREVSGFHTHLAASYFNKFFTHFGCEAINLAQFRCKAYLWLRNWLLHMSLVAV